jgi:pimeloyl-ACP methyl ester carboxylesterase
VPYVDVNGLRTWHEVRGEGEPVVYAKTLRMIETEPEIELASLTTVEAPTLILQGDRDEVTLEHGAAVATALPHGRLAVLPGTHLPPIESPEVVSTLLLWFLGAHRR